MGRESFVWWSGVWNSLLMNGEIVDLSYEFIICGVMDKRWPLCGS